MNTQDTFFFYLFFQINYLHQHGNLSSKKPPYCIRHIVFAILYSPYCILQAGVAHCTNFYSLCSIALPV